MSHRSGWTQRGRVSRHIADGAGASFHSLSIHLLGDDFHVHVCPNYLFGVFCSCDQAGLGVTLFFILYAEYISSVYKFYN